MRDGTLEEEGRAERFVSMVLDLTMNIYLIPVFNVSSNYSIIRFNLLKVPSHYKNVIWYFGVPFIENDINENYCISKFK